MSDWRPASIHETPMGEVLTQRESTYPDFYLPSLAEPVATNLVWAERSKPPAPVSLFNPEEDETPFRFQTIRQKLGSVSLVDIRIVGFMIGAFHIDHMDCKSYYFVTNIPAECIIMI
jgi:hypothetical protein